MKKAVLGLILSVCLMLTGACAKTGKSATNTATPDASAETTASSDVQLSPPSDSVIVAESSNTISDKEKQDVLDDLTDQLGASLDSLSDMEELDESDLDMDEIE